VPEFHDPAASAPGLARSASAKDIPEPAFDRLAFIMAWAATSAPVLSESASLACEEHPVDNASCLLKLTGANIMIEKTVQFSS